MDYPFPNLATPPLVEVSVGLQFEPLTQFRLPHFGLFWEKVREEFPTIEHAQPIISKGQKYLTDSATGLPIPRVWFIAPSDSKLIQLQPDRLHFNWRITPNAEPYPRYPAVVSSFFEYLDKLEKLLADNKLGIIQPNSAELTYINVLEPGREFESAGKLNGVFKDLHWSNKQRFLPTPASISWNTKFEMQSNMGILTASVKPGKRISDGLPILHFDLQASGDVIGNDRAELSKWFENAHEWIVKGFIDLTDRDTQKKYWGSLDV